MATHQFSRPFISSPLFILPNFRLFCSRAKFLPPAASLELRSRCRTTIKVPDTVLKEKWLESLSLPFDETSRGNDGETASGWVVGVDPDASGAVALLKPHDNCGVSAQVFDTPYLQVLIGKSLRKRLDARSIVNLLQNFGAPFGTIAYIEQSIPYPKDGKQGWWSGGFTYGLWIGILVASGFSVVPVASRAWKDHFDLWKRPSTKDDSRKVASVLFPQLESSLKRKKDHGRADALLIAAYGKGLKLHSDSTVLAEFEVPCQ